MAYTKILVIHNRLDKCVGYTQDPEKTSLEAAIDYALDRAKTEHTCYETAINCSRDRVYTCLWRAVITMPWKLRPQMDLSWMTAQFILR